MKIFIDTIATVSFSVITIVLSIVSIYIAMQANKISAKQVEVEKSENMPFFTIGLVKELLKDECKYKNYQIINTGGKINNALLVPIFRTQIIIGQSSCNYYYKPKDTFNFECNDLLENNEYFYDINQNGFNVEVRDDIINKMKSKIMSIFSSTGTTWSINVQLLFDITYVDFQGNYQYERYILSNNNLIRTKRFQRYEYLKHGNPLIGNSVDEKIDYWIYLVFKQLAEELENI